MGAKEELLEEQLLEEMGDADGGLDTKDKKYLKKRIKRVKRRAKKARYKEIKKALLGNLVPTEDGRMQPGGDFRISLSGSADGAFGTRLFGIAHMERAYRLERLNATQAVYQASEAMMDIGRSIVFETVQGGASCIIKHVFFRPTVLVFEHVSGTFTLTAYCGRDILTYSSMRRAIRLFKEHAPSGLVPVEQRRESKSGTKKSK